MITKEPILNALNQENWKDIFCLDKKDRFVDQYFEEDSISKMAETITVGSFYNEEECYQLLKQALSNHINVIVEWLNRRGPLKSMTLTYDHPIGYVQTKNNKEEAYKIHMILIKKPSSYFYVADFCPIL